MQITKIKQKYKLNESSECEGMRRNVITNSKGKKMHIFKWVDFTIIPHIPWRTHWSLVDKGLENLSG